MERRLLIVDDHAGFRRRARTLFARGGYDVVGEAEDMTSGVQAAADLRPEVVLLDVQLPDGDGFEAARRILAADVATTVVLISSRDVADYGGRIRESGARGFISKGELSVEALGTVLAGGAT